MKLKGTGVITLGVNTRNEFFYHVRFCESESNLEERWDNWSTIFEPGSVVYYAFGCQIILEKTQFNELVLRFKLTRLPFFVEVKPSVGTATIEEALTEGFEDRLRVLVPHLGGQILNTMLMADELKVGVEVKRGENGWISKENLSEAIKSVMDKDGEQRHHPMLLSIKLCLKMLIGAGAEEVDLANYEGFKIQTPDVSVLLIRLCLSKG
ncbi:Detected protein of unknown function [Hibiscus syriacus]|uniref:Uncharacterized protein n=1 Tax=Hibiscus syriacus TaxID=106335 RepID=A0A6A2XYP4_HIBSY|nr:Detected protein of unknown function [Hibiscus syriacus]